GHALSLETLPTSQSDRRSARILHRRSSRRDRALGTSGRPARAAFDRIDVHGVALYSVYRRSRRHGGGTGPCRQHFRSMEGPGIHEDSAARRQAFHALHPDAALDADRARHASLSGQLLLRGRQYVDARIAGRPSPWTRTRPRKTAAGTIAHSVDELGAATTTA